MAIVWFDHGVGTSDDPRAPGEWHFMLCDSENNQVLDFEIYDKTWRGKTFFAFISTCMSAKLDLINPLTGEPLGTGSYGANPGGYKVIGMPYAWTHGASLSTDGYANPDGGFFCYIGFPWGSAALAQEVDLDYPGVRYYDWVWDFFKYALEYDMTVNQALDHASYECFPPHYFGSTNLHTGFTTLWPGLPSYPGCTLVVYGNGNIHLYQHSFTVLAKDQYGNYFANKDVYIDLMHNLANTGSTIKITGGYHTVFVNDFWEPGYTGYRYTFQYYTYDGTTYYPNPATWNFYKDWTVTAQFYKAYRPGDVDGDGDADQTDWNLFNNYAYPSVRGDPNWDSRCDFNSDGDVDAEDRSYLYSIIYRGNEIASRSGYLSGTGATYTFSIPNLAGTYTVVLVGNELADFDLYAKWNSPPTRSSYDARSWTSYSSEYFTVTGSGTLYVMVDSWSGSGNWRVNVVAGSPSASSGRKVGSLSGTGATATYSLTGSGRAWVYLAGPDGNDFDLYLKWNSPPTTSSYDARGFSSWAHEIVTCTGSGTLYYMVHSYSGSGEYTMLAFIF